MHHRARWWLVFSSQVHSIGMKHLGEGMAQSVQRDLLDDAWMVEDDAFFLVQGQPRHFPDFDEDDAIAIGMVREQAPMCLKDDVPCIRLGDRCIGEVWLGVVHVSPSAVRGWMHPEQMQHPMPASPR